MARTKSCLKDRKYSHFLTKLLPTFCPQGVSPRRCRPPGWRRPPTWPTPPAGWICSNVVRNFASSHGSRASGGCPGTWISPMQKIKSRMVTMRSKRKKSPRPTMLGPRTRISKKNRISRIVSIFKAGTFRTPVVFLVDLRKNQNCIVAFLSLYCYLVNLEYPKSTSIIIIFILKNGNQSWKLTCQKMK